MTGDRSEKGGGGTVAEIMTRPVVTMTPETTAGEARRIFQNAWIRHLPVMEGELLVGIVSERDLARAVGDAMPVEEIMTQPVFVLSPAATIRQAARILAERRLGALPVLDGRQLVGMVSVVDVMRLAGGALEPGGWWNR
jgi:acetoin utilization protein AcuB